LLDRRHDDHQIECRRPVLDVEEIQPLMFSERRVVTRFDMPQSCQAGENPVRVMPPRAGQDDLGGHRRPRPDEAHLSAQHVEQLWQTVETGFA
jgi:hypothetical protein